MTTLGVTGMPAGGGEAIAKDEEEDQARAKRDRMLKLAYNSVLHHVGVNLDNEPGPAQAQSEN